MQLMRGVTYHDYKAAWRCDCRCGQAILWPYSLAVTHPMTRPILLEVLPLNRQWSPLLQTFMQPGSQQSPHLGSRQAQSGSK